MQTRKDFWKNSQNWKEILSNQNLIPVKETYHLSEH
jgi:hypothetical protein